MNRTEYLQRVVLSVMRRPARISLPFFYRWPNDSGTALVKRAYERFKAREPVAYAHLYGDGTA